MSQNTPNELHCTKCDTVKPITCFGKSKKRRYGRAIYCRDCMNAIGRVAKRKHREKCNEYNRRYRAENRDDVRSWGKRQYDNNRELRLQQAKNWRATRHGHARMMHLAARQRAKKKGCEYEISPEIIIAYMTAQNERCAMTGIEFDYTYDDQHKYRPFAPSIDRKDNAMGYLLNNIRIVCTIVNKARNEYSDDLFDRMCIARVEQLNRDR